MFVSFFPIQQFDTYQNVKEKGADNMKNKYLVIGGYGQVGGIVAKRLCEEGKNVVIAGRNLELAKEYIRKNHLSCDARKIDVEAIHADQLQDIKTIIMCLEQNNEIVLSNCIQYKINYIDITPSYTIIQKLQQREKDVMKAGITVVLGVGIAPGISNLLCKKAAMEFNQVLQIESYLMLGTGEKHGKNAIQWLIHNLNVKYKENNDPKTIVRSFSDDRKIKLIHEKKKRRFVRIDLADWHIMKEKYPEAKVTSWYAYDTNFVTGYFEFLQSMHIFRLLKYHWFESFFTKLLTTSMSIFQKLRIGSPDYATMIKVTGKDESGVHTISYQISGEQNSIITADICAKAGIKTEEMEGGFFFLEDILSSDDINKTIMTSR